MERGSAALVVLFVLFLLIGGGVGYLVFKPNVPFNVSPIPKSQVLTLPSLKTVEASTEATIKTYHDDDLKITFNYPSNEFSVKNDTEEEYNKRENGNYRKYFSGYIGYEPGAFVKALDVLKSDDYKFAPFVIWVFENPNNLDSKAWFNSYWYYPFNWGQFEIAEKAKLAPDKEATISGEFVKYGTIAYQDQSPDYYYLPQEGKMLLIRVLHDDQKIGQQILSSLQLGK